MARKRIKKAQRKIELAKRKQERHIAKMEQRKYWQEVYKKLYDFIKSIQFKDSFYKSKSTRLYNDIVLTSNHVAREIYEKIYDSASNYDYVECILDKLNNEFDNIEFLIEEVEDYCLFDSSNKDFMQELINNVVDENVIKQANEYAEEYNDISDNVDDFLYLILYVAAMYNIRYDEKYMREYVEEAYEEIKDQWKEDRFNWYIHNKSVI